MKYFVFSDVHNSYNALVKALDSSGFHSEDDNHKLLFLGDAFEKGDKPKETYLFLKEMLSKNKLIWIRGNHDMELVNSVSINKLNNTNRSTALAVASVFNGAVHTDEEICEVLKSNGFVDWILKNSRNFFETEQYIFVHGFIPSVKGNYEEDWRNLPDENWGGARKKCAVREVLKNGIRFGKTVVSGHVGAYYGHIKEKYPNYEFDSPEFKKAAAKIVRTKPPEYYKTFYGDGVIGIDANAYDTGFVNCLVIDD